MVHVCVRLFINQLKRKMIQVSQKRANKEANKSDLFELRAIILLLLPSLRCFIFVDKNKSIKHKENMKMLTFKGLFCFSFSLSKLYLISLIFNFWLIKFETKVLPKTRNWSVKMPFNLNFISLKELGLTKKSSLLIKGARFKAQVKAFRSGL